MKLGVLWKLSGLSRCCRHPGSQADRVHYLTLGFALQANLQQLSVSMQVFG